MRCRPEEPILTQEQSIVAISEAEAGIAQCMADFLCNTILPAICAIESVDDQVELTKSIFCAYTCKEKGMAAVIEALAKIIIADKGLVPGCCDTNDCKC